MRCIPSWLSVGLRRWVPRSGWTWLPAAVVLVVAGTVAVGVAYARRVAPPWPAVAGAPYAIALDAGGCPVTEASPSFVDRPGDLVPRAGAVQVLLCVVPADSGAGPSTAGPSTAGPSTAGPSAAAPEAAPSRPGFGRAAAEPRQRILRTGVAAFVARMDAMPDRNTAFRQWQRKYSGWWPDAPPATMDPLIFYPYRYSFVVRYADRPPVAVIEAGGPGAFTTGTRTRTDTTKPHLVDVFRDLYQRQEDR